MTAPIDPDCQQGKHAACRGGACSNDLDRLVDCSCHCHRVQTTLAAAGVHVIRFPYATKPIDANGSRGSHFAHYRKVATVKHEAAWRAKAQRIPALERGQVGLFWYVTTARRRDSDNLGPVAKAMVDGLVVAGVFTDDHDGIVTRHQPQIIRVDRSLYLEAWMELVVAPLHFTWTTDYRAEAQTIEETR